MTGSGITYRVATAADMPAMTIVRTSVKENHLSVEQMAARGITDEAVAASFLEASRCWVAECGGRIVGFAIADRNARSIFALFVLPGFDARGIGGELLERALAWLWQTGAVRIWLTTGRGTRAAAFYERKGWNAVGAADNNQIRFELRRPR